MRPCFSVSALLLVTATLSPAAATAPSKNDATGGDIYPPLWDLAPENLLDYLVKNNKIVINAWNYLERLGAYKILLSSSAKYFNASGSQHFDNILWGLPLQHGWQFRTGRLADPSGVTSCGYDDGDPLCLSVRSWWACMNYYLAVIPFLGAVEAGLFGQLPYDIEILPPEEQRAHFCYSVADCRSHIPKIMDDWKAYFQYLLSTHDKAVSPGTFSAFNPDDALSLMWRAHVGSIAYALPKFQDSTWDDPQEVAAQDATDGRLWTYKERWTPLWEPGLESGAVFKGSNAGEMSLKYLSDPEANFGEDWANGVEFIAATHFSTDLLTVNRLQASLPQRMLVKGDVAPDISDFSPQQNRVLLALKVLHKTNQVTGGLLLKLWRKAMSTEEGRKMGRNLIEDFALSPKFDLTEIHNEVKGADLTALVLEEQQFQR